MFPLDVIPRVVQHAWLSCHQNDRNHNGTPANPITSQCGPLCYVVLQIKHSIMRSVMIRSQDSSTEHV